MMVSIQLICLGFGADALLVPRIIVRSFWDSVLSLEHGAGSFDVVDLFLLLATGLAA